MVLKGKKNTLHTFFIIDFLALGIFIIVNNLINIYFCYRNSNGYPPVDSPTINTYQYTLYISILFIKSNVISKIGGEE